ncbi:MAG TPA: M24 family metallopeptidase [Pyrinomonadaceae bacterium]|jgi:Xaa-Pro aminopeptidase
MMRTKRARILLLLTASLIFFVNAQAQDSPAARVAEIQKALREAKLDGWLFYDFRGSDPLAYRILKLGATGITTRRWFYYIPATGEPVKIVHSIERGKLDALPGKRVVYLPWQELHDDLREALTGRRKARSVEIRVGSGKRIAMQYSPENAIPYISRVDAGTIELIRSFGVEPVTSADLVQKFEAVWTPEQLQMHNEAADKVHSIIMESFAELARRIRANIPTTEYDIQQFMEKRFAEENMTNDDDPPIIAVNGNAANPHYQPTREIHSPIKRGDFVLFDVWYRLKKPDAVYADQTWTGYVGESVPEEYTRIFNIVRDARDAAVAYVQKSLGEGKVFTGASVDDVSRGLITRAGYGAQFLHRTGHSIDEEVHGNGANIDDLETKDSRKIIPRTCFSIEPGIYLEGKFGVRSEINVYVVNEHEAVVTGQPIQTAIVAILKK